MDIVLSAASLAEKAGVRIVFRNDILSVGKNQRLSDGLFTSNTKVHFVSRVPLSQDEGLPGGRDVGINFRCGNGAVAQQGLDVANVHPRVQQDGGKGVPEHMRGDVAVHCRLIHASGEDLPHPLGGQRLFPAVEQDAMPLVDRPLKSLQISLRQRDDLRRGDLQRPLFAPFAVNEQPQAATRQMEVIRRQAAQLGDPDTGAEQQFQHQSVPQGPTLSAVTIFPVDALQESLHDSGRNDPRQLLGIGDVEPKAAKGAFLNSLLFLQRTVKRPNAGQLPFDGSGREMLIQVGCIASQQRLVHGGVLSKGGKLGQVDAVCL